MKDEMALKNYLIKFAPALKINIQETQKIQDRFRNFCECEGCNLSIAISALSIEPELKSILTALGLPDRSTVYPLRIFHDLTGVSKWRTEQWAWPLLADEMTPVDSEVYRISELCKIWLTDTPPVRGDIQRKIRLPEDLKDKSVVWLIALVKVPKGKVLFSSFRVERYREACPECNCRVYVSFYFKRKSPFLRLMKERGMISVISLKGSRLKSKTCVLCGRQVNEWVSGKGPFYNKSLERPETKAFNKEWRSRTAAPAWVKRKPRIKPKKRSWHRLPKKYR
jgi:hypothetical protein